MISVPFRKPSIHKVLILIWFSVLSGCGLVGDGALLDYNRLQYDLDAAKKLWRNASISNYQYISKKICFCPQGDALVVVLNNQVVQADFIDPGRGSAIGMGLDLTVEQHFSKIQHAISSRFDSISVEYDQTYGFPKSASFDGSEDAIDDEITYIMRDFQVIGN